MGLFDDIGKAFNDGSALSDVGDWYAKNIVQNFGNLYGVDNNGKWTNQGGAFKWIDEGFGEITGRNQSRAALNFSKDQFATAQQQAQNLIKQQQWEKQNADLLASSSAKAATDTAKQLGGATYQNSTPLGRGSGAGQPQRDFLGL